MTPDDPRHGSVAGYVAGCRAKCCRQPAWYYEKRRRHDHASHRPRQIPSVGTVRRVQALVAIGWPTRELAERLGVHAKIIQRLIGQEIVLRTTAKKITALYDELSMTPGPSDISRRRAKARGWAPPLAWDDIDDPNEQPNEPKPDREAVDEVLVQRALNGQKVKANRAERAEIIRRWTGSHKQLIETQRWNWRVFKEAS